MPPLETLAILSFIVFCIPIVGSLWRIFSAKSSLEKLIDDGDELLEKQITNNAHRLDLLEQRIEHLVDQYTLAQNGQRELVQHVRERSKSAEERLLTRVSDVERFLEKKFEFVPRQASPNSGIFPQ